MRSASRPRQQATACAKPTWIGALGAWRDRMQSSQLPTWLRPSSGGIASVDVVGVGRTPVCRGAADPVARVELAVLAVEDLEVLLRARAEARRERQQPRLGELEHVLGRVADLAAVLPREVAADGHRRGRDTGRRGTIARRRSCGCRAGRPARSCTRSTTASSDSAPGRTGAWADPSGTAPSPRPRARTTSTDRFQLAMLRFHAVSTRVIWPERARAHVLFGRLEVGAAATLRADLDDAIGRLHDVERATASSSRALRGFSTNASLPARTASRSTPQCA